MRKILIRLTKDEQQYIRDHMEDTNRAIAEWIGCVPNTVMYWKRRFGLDKHRYQMWTVSEKEKLMKLWNLNMTCKEISRHLGRPASVIHGMVTALRGSGWDFKRRYKNKQ